METASVGATSAGSMAPGPSAMGEVITRMPRARRAKYQNAAPQRSNERKKDAGG
jgi:hypothetical protein